MWEKQKNPNQLLSERAKNIVLSEIPITLRNDGKVRVSMSSSKRSQLGKSVEDCKENATLPNNNNIKLKSAPLESKFSLKNALTRNSYEFKPPAAAKYFLWDNTRIGNTLFCNPADLLHDRITITSGALKALRIELLKRNLIETSSSTIVPQKITGYLFGSIINQRELVLDRFDTGSKGRLPGNHIVAVLSGSLMVTDGFNYESLLEATKECLNSQILSDVTNAFPMYVYFQSDGKQPGLPFYRTLLPNYSLEIYPIHPLRLVNTSFSHKLLNDQVQCPTFGLISIDQARQIYPLDSNDPLSTSIPLIGVWVKGLDTINNRLVFNACYQYISNQKCTKLDTGKSEILIYHFPTEKGGRIQCYECSYVLTPSDSAWDLYGTENNCLFKNITYERRFKTALEKIFEIRIPEKAMEKHEEIPPEEEDSIQIDSISTPALQNSSKILTHKEVNDVDEEKIEEVGDTRACEIAEVDQEIQSKASEAKSLPASVIESPKIVESPLPVKTEQVTPQISNPSVEPSVAILQQQISALQTQLLNMASLAITNQHQIPVNYLYPKPIYNAPMSVPTRDASTSPIPFIKPEYESIGVQAEVDSTSTPTREVGLQTEINQVDQDVSKEEPLQESNVDEIKDETQLGVIDGKKIIMRLVENAEQSFIFTDKSDEEESVLTSPATSIFSQPKPMVVKRMPFSRLRGTTVITEESFSRTELPTFDDASLSFATTKYLEKYGLSP